jgi:predicted DNA binding CopG/RHH family protein
MKLTRQEKAIEDALLRGGYKSVSKEKFNEIVQSLEARKKDAVLNIRINQGDLNNLKDKAKRLGVKYQSFIAEILHNVASA